jgi:uncharacterized membrane protein
VNAEKKAEPKKASARFQRFLRDSLVAGIVSAVPLVAVWWVFDRVILNMDGVLGFLPEQLREITWTPPFSVAPIPFLKTPGLGFVLTMVLLVFVGAFARGFVGRALVRTVVEPIRRTPVLGTIYSAVRQLLETVFSKQAQSFQRVVLVQFPRKGAYVLGFVTAKAWEGVEQAVGRSMVSVFVPTTPNPTSGFFIMFAEEECIPLNMTVEEAFKSIMSSGIVVPADGGALGIDVGTMTMKIEAVTLDDE